jgi:hypothetical protein
MPEENLSKDNTNITIRNKPNLNYSLPLPISYSGFFTFSNIKVQDDFFRDEAKKPAFDILSRPANEVSLDAAITLLINGFCESFGEDTYLLTKDQLTDRLMNPSIDKINIYFRSIGFPPIKKSDKCKKEEDKCLPCKSSEIPKRGNMNNQ